jgi:hypothetical protein
MYKNKLSKYQNKLKQVGSGVPLVDIENGLYASTVFSHLRGEHAHGRGILANYNTREATQLLRSHNNKELREAIAIFPWNDLETRITGPLAEWRAIFPNAIAANISNRNDLTDADFVHLRGIHRLNMSGCNQIGITDAAFANLVGIHTLDMSGCNQTSITNAVFPYLRGIHTLHMNGC